MVEVLHIGHLFSSYLEIVNNCSLEDARDEWLQREVRAMFVSIKRIPVQFVAFPIVTLRCFEQVVAFPVAFRKSPRECKKTPCGAESSCTEDDAPRRGSVGFNGFGIPRG